MNNTLNDATENLYTQLCVEGKSKEEALLFISEQYEAAINLKDQMIDFGYEESEAYTVATVKLTNSLANREMKTLNMGKLIPVRALDEVMGEGGWDRLTRKHQDRTLWELGFNTRTNRWFTNAGCFNYCGKRECGVFIQGNERLDKEWLTKTIGDASVASVEAKYHKNKSTLEELRGNQRDY